jgi:hypothetical protein
LLAKFQPVEDPVRASDLGFADKFWQVEHDFVLARSRE